MNSGRYCASRFGLMRLDVERPPDPRDCRLARELAEELGPELRVGDLAFAAENIFDGNGIQHEIGLYYHVAWPAALAPADLRRESR